MPDRDVTENARHIYYDRCPAEMSREMQGRFITIDARQRCHVKGWEDLLPLKPDRDVTENAMHIYYDRSPTKLSRKRQGIFITIEAGQSCQEKGKAYL